MNAVVSKYHSSCLVCQITTLQNLRLRSSRNSKANPIIGPLAKSSLVEMGTRSRECLPRPIIQRGNISSLIPLNLIGSTIRGRADQQLNAIHSL